MSDAKRLYREIVYRGQLASSSFCLRRLVATTLRSTRRHLRQEGCKLLLKRLGCPGAPALGNGLRHRIGKNLLFAFLQPIEDASCNQLRRSLWDVQVSRHIGVHWTCKNGMNLDATSSPQSAQRLRQRERGCLRDRVGWTEWHTCQARQRQDIDDGSMRASHVRQEGHGHAVRTEEVDGEVPVESGAIA